MSPKMAESLDPAAVISWFWSDYPYTLGSYASAKVGQYTTMLEVASEPALAAACNGGVESGNRAAEALIEVMAPQKK